MAAPPDGADEATGREAAPVQPLELDDRLAAGLLPTRDPRGHKGTHGTVLVVAGSLDYAGAAQLVALAAGRAGAGLVCLAVPRSLQPIFAGRTLEAITVGLPEDAADRGLDVPAALGALAARDHDALVVGSGLQPGAATSALVDGLLRGASGEHPGGDPPSPAVLDAEALNSLAAKPGWWTGLTRACVLTPHPGEFVRLAGLEPEARVRLGSDDDARATACRDAAREWGQTVVLKGARTVIAAADGRLARAPFMNPALATAGTGDVLAGTIGAFLAQGLGPYEAACLGVYLHGAAGEEIRSELGEAGLLAGDLPAYLPVVSKRLAAVRDRSPGRLGFAARERSR